MTKRFAANRRRASTALAGVVQAFLIIIAGVLASAGCEKFPWPTKGKDPHSLNAKPTTAATATTPNTTTPSKPPVLPSDTLAIVNGAPISKADVELRIEELRALVKGLKQEWKPLTAEQLEAVLKESVNTELMSQDAVARGLDRSADTQRRWAFMRRAFFAQEWLRNRNRQEISAEEIQKYYDQNKLGFRDPERRKLREIVVGSEDQAKQALSKLLGESMDFASLAQQISLGSNAKDGGQLSDWVMRDSEKRYRFGTEQAAKAAGVISLDPSLEAAAFAIDHENGLSSYVKGPDSRYHIFQLVKMESARQVPITEVWDTIKGYLTVQKLQQAIDELSSKAKIERFPERLSEITQ